MNNYSLTLSSSLLADLMSGSDLSLRMSAVGTNTSYLFSSRSSTTPPELIINAVPEPASLALGVLGAVSILAFRRWSEKLKAG